MHRLCSFCAACAAVAVVNFLTKVGGRTGGGQRLSI